MLLLAQPAPGGSIVVVEDQVAHASEDGGRSYHPIHRVGPNESIFDAAVGSDGTLYALRGEFLDIVRGGRSTSHAIADARRVAVSGRTIAVLRAAAVDFSVDGGATFVTRDLPRPCPECDPTLQGAVDFTVASGAPFVVETSINTCTSWDILEWQRLVQIGGGSTFQRNIAVPRADYAASWHFGAFGWMYGVSYAKRLLAVSAGGAEPVDGLAGAISSEITIAHNARVTVATIGTALVELNGAHARVLDARTKPGDLLAVDGDDRPLVSDGKELWRFSRVSGWTKLALP